MIISKSTLNFHLRNGVIARYKDSVQIVPDNPDEECIDYDLEHNLYLYPFITHVKEINDNYIPLSLHKLFFQYNGTILSNDINKIGYIEELIPINNMFHIYPKSYYIGQTLEFINLPKKIIGKIYPNPILITAGISISSSIFVENSFGNITVGLYNNTTELIKIEKNFKFINIQFEE